MTLFPSAYLLWSILGNYEWCLPIAASRIWTVICSYIGKNASVEQYVSRNSSLDITEYYTLVVYYVKCLNLFISIDLNVAFLTLNMELEQVVLICCHAIRATSRASNESQFSKGCIV